MKIIGPYKVFEDKRGRMFGIINSGEWQEINLLETDAGNIRGGHYHKKTKELFYIIEGIIDIEIKDIHGNITAEFSAEKDSVFMIEPYEVHTFKIKTNCKWINMLSQKMNESDEDIDIYKL